MVVAGLLAGGTAFYFTNFAPTGKLLGLTITSARSLDYKMVIVMMTAAGV